MRSSATTPPAPELSCTPAPQRAQVNDVTREPIIGRIRATYPQGRLVVNEDPLTFDVTRESIRQRKVLPAPRSMGFDEGNMPSNLQELLTSVGAMDPAPAA